jgi:hypothetical protein
MYKPGTTGERLPTTTKTGKERSLRLYCNCGTFVGTHRIRGNAMCPVCYAQKVERDLITTAISRLRAAGYTIIPPQDNV